MNTNNSIPVITSADAYVAASIATTGSATLAGDKALEILPGSMVVQRVISAAEPHQLFLSPEETNEIVFIDPAIDYLDSLLVGLRPDVQFIVLDCGESGPSQIAKMLCGRSALSTIHIIAHGRPGEVCFGSGSITLENLNEHADELAAIGCALGDGGDLLLWTCHTAQGHRGQAFVQAISQLTKADVSATTGLVGATAKGGYWALDGTVNVMAERAPLSAVGRAHYAGLMTDYHMTNGVDNFTGSDDDDNFIFQGGGANAGDAIDGSGGIDFIVVSGAADLHPMGNGFSSIEGLTIYLNSTAIFDYSQLAGGTGQLPTNLSVNAQQGTGNHNIFIEMPSSGSVNLSSWTFTGWGGYGDNIIIDGSSSADTITGSSQKENIYGNDGDDTIMGFAGADIVSGGSGNNGINLAATSPDLNSATDGQIGQIQWVSFQSATADVTLDLHNQSESFVLTGSSFNDMIIGGAGLTDTVVFSGSAPIIPSR